MKKYVIPAIAIVFGLTLSLSLSCGKKDKDCPDCPVAIPTAVPTSSATNTPTSTPVITNTATSTPSNSPTNTASSTATLTATATPTASPTPFSTPAYLTQWGGTGNSNGQFNDPSGVAVDGSNNVYVADWGNNRVQKFTSSGSFVAVWGGPSNGTNPGQFYQPYDVTVDSLGNVYVADTTNNRIQKLPTGLDGTVGGNWLTFGGTSTGTNPGQFNNPIGVGTDGANNLFVTDDYNNRIQKLPAGMDGTVEGNWVTYGGPSNGTNPGQFYDPIGLAFNVAGDLYVADSNNQRIQVLPAGLDPAVGANWVTFGSLGTNPGQFQGPLGPGLDASGKLGVADVFNNRIQILPAGKNGGVGANWLVLGSFGTGNGQFNNPHGVAFDSAGNMYVADALNNRIQKFAP